MSGLRVSRLDPELGYVPAIPLPFFHWQFWQWNCVSCECGAKFYSLSDYERHYVLTHVERDIGEQ